MRVFFGTIAGLIIAFLIIGALNAIGRSFYPAHLVIDPYNIEEIRANWSKIPEMSLALVIAAQFFGIIFGTAIAKLITGGSKIPGYTIGGLILISSVVNLFVTQPAIWFIITDILVVIISYWIGIKISKKRVKS